MSIALDRIEAGFMHGGAAAAMTSFGLVFDESSSPAANPVTSSSLGKNSDDDESLEENDEAESSYKGPLDMMEALEDVLPIRRGISKFYNYKSKSFTRLAEAATSSSIKEIAKPDDPYTKKRRNILASTLIWDKNKNSSLRSICGGRISKQSQQARAHWLWPCRCAAPRRVPAPVAIPVLVPLQRNSKTMLLLGDRCPWLTCSNVLPLQL